MVPYNRRLKTKARSLRTNPTDAELHLWYRLRRKQILGVQFYRQKPIGNYIADFICHTARIVIELDGETHDFESRYLDGLVGPLPGYEAIYAERSPVGHVTAATCPILLLQGLDDPIVPPAQSEAIAAQLAEYGIRHAYLAFEGESHGFRRAETITRCLEAELSFYGQNLGFSPPGIPVLAIVTGRTR